MAQRQRRNSPRKCAKWKPKSSNAEDVASGERIARLFSAVAEAVQQEFQPSQFRNVETLSHSLQVDDAAEHRLVLAQLADASWLAVTFRDSPF